METFDLLEEFGVCRSIFVWEQAVDDRDPGAVTELSLNENVHISHTGTAVVDWSKIVPKCQNRKFV